MQPSHELRLFVETVEGYYAEYARALPWRDPSLTHNYDPYHILVSEMMLQQTQVGRVVPYFERFISELPTLRHLADAPLATVLRLWSGLGYNRRAKYLHTAGKMLRDKPFPDTQEQLVALPGVGKNTAGAIRTYAFNMPALFFETNIRTVFIHHFFKDAQQAVSDADIEPFLAGTLSMVDDYRQWYYALMDYGTYLKASYGNATRASSHYARQSAFHGSKRQLRGRILRELQHGAICYEQLMKALDDPRYEVVIKELQDEGLIIRRGSHVQLPE